jgi:hypothetical protein
MTIAGEPIEVALYATDKRTRNEITENLVEGILENRMEIRIRICWSTGQETRIRFPSLWAGRTVPEERLLIGSCVTKCVATGYAEVYLELDLDRPSRRLSIDDANGQSITMFGPNVEEQSPTGKSVMIWSGHQSSAQPIHSFWVIRREEIYQFWVFVLSVITTSIAVLALVFSVLT